MDETPIEEVAKPDEPAHDPFLDAGVEMELLHPDSLANRPSVLERLGPAHFRSKGFSFMGFLQTVYDHVAEHTKKNGQ